MVTNIISWLVILICISWFALSVINQHRKWRRLISPVVSRDICSLVPTWTFFAPNPGRTDLYILYRDRDAEGNISDWREVRTATRSSWFDQWSPLRRIHKGITDLSSNFTNDLVYEPKQPVSKRHVVGFHYLLFLNYVCTKPADFRASMRQFAMARTNGHGTENNPEVIFLSAFHKIEYIT